MTDTQKIENLKRIFGGSNLRVRSRISEEVGDMFDKYNNQPAQAYTLDDLINLRFTLEEHLKRAKLDLKQAQQYFNNNRITKEDLLVFEKKVSELENEIEYIDSKI